MAIMTQPVIALTEHAGLWQ